MAEINVNIEPNSKSYKASQGERKEKPKVEPVIKKGSRVIPKESFGKKIFKSFLAEEVNDVKEYIIVDCIIPGIKNAILNMASMAFFGESYDRRGGYRNSRDRRDYGSYYDYGRSSYGSSSRDRDRREDQNKREERGNVDYRNIVLRYREDAERVVSSMRSRIRETGGVSIAELLALIDEPSKYTDTDYGWLDERDVGIRRVSSGYLIDLTEARYLN